MATFVLVHGAWHGGWCWNKVAPLLRRTGSTVYTPTLSGLGERAHLTELLDPSQVNLDLHVRDVVQLLEYEELSDVVLVGHAYAGMVITGVAEVCPERLLHLVYVNGVIPADGECMADQLIPVRGRSLHPGCGAISRGVKDTCPRRPPRRRLGAAGESRTLQIVSGCSARLPLSRPPRWPGRCASAIPQRKKYLAVSSAARRLDSNQWLTAPGMPGGACITWIPATTRWSAILANWRRS